MTNDLIRRGKLLEKFTELKEKAPTLQDAVYLDGVMAVIDAQSAVDAVEVVRCKDCQGWNESACPFDGKGLCEWGCTTTDFDDFCKYGKRRESEVSE